LEGSKVYGAVEAKFRNRSSSCSNSSGSSKTRVSILGNALRLQGFKRDTCQPQSRQRTTSNVPSSLALSMNAWRFGRLARQCPQQISVDLDEGVIFQRLSGHVAGFSGAVKIFIDIDIGLP